MNIVLILKKADSDVLKIHTLIRLSDLIVIGYEVIDETLLPEALRFIKMMDKYLACKVIEMWLLHRSISMYRPDIDHIICTLLGADEFRFGRMSCRKHIVNLFSYYASGFDDYIITPEKERYFNFSIEEQKLLGIWGLRPWTGRIEDDPDVTDLIASGNKNHIFFKNGCIATRDLTIYSTLPSWWDGNDLHQNVPEHLLEKILGGYTKYGTKSIELCNNEVILRFKEGETVTWFHDIEIGVPEYDNRFEIACETAKKVYGYEAASAICFAVRELKNTWWKNGSGSIGLTSENDIVILF